MFITGHGGNEFMKFQDQQELMAGDVADALAQVRKTERQQLSADGCQHTQTVTDTLAQNKKASQWQLEAHAGSLGLTT